jgi:hypothetical protein
MGNNVDFCYLMGCPEKIKCPHCKKVINSQLEDWDIDCGTEHNLNKYSFEIECENCGFMIPIEIEVKADLSVDGKKVTYINNKCKECGEIMDTEEEIIFGECNNCSAYKYRNLSR